MLKTLSSRPEILWLHLGSEIFITLAFYFLTAALVYFFYLRKDLKFRWAFFPAFFFFFAGTVHALRLVAPWRHVYVLEALLKIFAAGFAIGFAVLLPRWLVALRRLPHPSATETLLKKRLSEEFQRVEEEMQLLPALMQALTGVADLHNALEITLHKICETLGWDYGETWLVAENGKVLEYSPACHGAQSFEGLRRVSRELRFPSKIGLPGTVWAAKAPVILEDISSAGSVFFRTQICGELGLKSAVGIPIFKGQDIVAVFVFLLRQFTEADRRRVPLIAAAARQLGCVLEREIAEQTLREAQEQQEKRIRERTKELIKTNQALEEEIAEHKRNEELLKKSQENFSTLVNSIDGIVWEFDLQTSKFTFISEQAEPMLGYPVDAWFAEPTFWQDHIHGGDRPHAVAFRTRVVQEKKPARFDYRMITADGQTIWLRDLVSVVIENDQVVKLRGVMVNITEPKHVEEALNNERNFVSAVFETAGALVMVLDTEGRVVRFNRACEQTSGYSANEAKGKYFWELFSIPEEVAKAKTIFARLLAGQFPINDESYWAAKDGSRRAIAWSNTVLLNKYGAVLHVIATGIDITKRKEVEQQLKEAISDLARSNRELDNSSQELKVVNQRLREMDQIKSHFISAASHELRTPLTSIKGYVDSILEDEVGPLNEQQKQFLGYVKAATDRLHRLLNELLDISKIESGQVKMNKNLTNLRDLLHEEMMIFKAQAQNRDIRLDIEMDVHLREIYCDADKIREVMDNLLSNALKYTPKGGQVKIEARNVHENGVKIAVQDTGIGIDKEDQARIFEPFQHIEKNGIEEEESTGLGLTLARRIVEAHDGQILVSSQPGKGSTFTVILPSGSSNKKAERNSWALAHHE